jgi:hypothetical protein
VSAARLSPTALALLERVERSADQVARRFRAHLHRLVASYRFYPSDKIEENAAQLTRLFIVLMRAGSSGFPIELEQWVRERAALGLGVGDAVMAVALLGATAREVVLADLADAELRAGLAAWVEVDQVVASVLGWTAERFHQFLAVTPK